MIEESDAMLGLVVACPSFGPAWEEHRRENGNDLLYSAAGEFARHLLDLYRADRVSTFPAIAAAIERLHVEGSPWVREFATIGVLEGIQNVWGNSGVDPAHFAAYLGPEALRWWNGLNEFWNGRAKYVRAYDP
jgi:hypothetical protein